MGARLPPNPSQYGSVEEWARQFYQYQLNAARLDQSNDPLPVLLPHRVNNVTERAAVDGILMYDPTLKAVVYSEDGVWKELAKVL